MFPDCIEPEAGGFLRHAINTSKNVSEICVGRHMKKGHRYSRAAPWNCGNNAGYCSFAVFRFGLLLDGDIGIGVFPEGEKVLVLGCRFGGVSY